jgi:putative two-component system response regulator
VTGVERQGRADVDTALVVDDDPQMRRLLAALLSGQGFACEVAGDVAEARTRLLTSAPELVLLDVRMPGESGIALARELSGRRAGPAVLMVSGEDDAEVAQIALDAGALGYVTKPFRRSDLEIAVRNARQRRAEALRSRADQTRLEERVIERSGVARDALERLRAANEETVLRLSKVVEYRDPETGSHIERMSHYCSLVAAAFGLDPDMLRVASRLHDVGKIAIRDSILHKPGAFTTAERAEMQRHADIGHRLLTGSNIDVLEQAATIAWTHHERFDGDGYPRGLAGDEIPVVGRLAAVADVFDALTTDRVYHSAVPVDDALAVLTAERGRQFDPAVVDAFVAGLDEVRAIRMRFAEEPLTESPEAADTFVPVTLLTLQHAAETIGVSPARLRRWSDEGRIETTRTAGGHRRFELDAVRRLAAAREVGPTVRPLQPPTTPLPTLATCLRESGAQQAEGAVTALYRGGAPGWFAGEDAGVAREEWLRELARGCDSGRFEGALHASDVFMRRGQTRSASLLERHSFLERFGHAMLQALSRAGAEPGETAGVRRLFGALQQAHLASRP